MSSPVLYLVQSIQTEERKKIFEENKRKFPQLMLFKTINGYEPLETLKYYKQMNYKYDPREIWYNEKKMKYSGITKYGTIACWLTKVKALEFQVNRNIKYICLIEDDLLLKDGFREAIESKLKWFDDEKKLDMIRLGKWGEGYIFSLNGAKRLLKNFKKFGIQQAIDIQLRNIGVEQVVIDNTIPWDLLVEPNKGDRRKTETINIKLFS